MRSTGRIEYIQGVDTDSEGASDRDMLNAAVRDRTSLQLLLDTGRHKRQSVECIIPGLQTRVSDHSAVVDIVIEDLHSTMRCDYESCLQSILAQIAGGVCNSDASYHSDVDT